MSAVIPQAEIWGEPCLAGKRALTCRYLVFGPGQTEYQFECAKHNEVLKAQIDSRVERGLMTAVGDNCEGKRS